MHGPCNGTGRKHTIKPDYVQDNFQGKALFVNGEPFATLFPLQDYPCGARFGCPNSTTNLYQIGSVKKDIHAHALRVFYAAVVLWEYMEPEQQAWIFDHAQKRNYKNRPKALT
jgi:hypothetical protein